MGAAILILILDETVFISHPANTFGQILNPTTLSPIYV